jgi:hypothetical protein
MSTDFAIDDRPPAAIAPALAAIAARLRRVSPSANLDASMEVLIDHVVAPEARSTGGNWTRYVIAAGVAVLTVLGLAIVSIAVWVTIAGDGEQLASPAGPAADSQRLVLDPAPHAGGHDLGLVVADGAYSLWPTEAAVFRVRTSFDAVVPAGDAARNERQFWVDVRVANDGSMRIVRIVPAEELSAE